MGIIESIILSVVEGFSEFLPISSTGHLVLAAHVLSVPQTEFVKSFEIIIQLGAILAAVFLYWGRVIKNFELWKRVIVAFIPSAIFGLVFYQLIKDVLLGNLYITLGALLTGGVVLIVIEKVLGKKEAAVVSLNQISLRQSFVIGLFQVISMIPGVSRAGASIIGGLLGGLDRKTAVEFSFILAIPTMFAATGLDLYKSNFAYSMQEILILGLGFFGSFISAALAIKLFIRLIQKHSLAVFGWYRIVLAIVYFLVFLG